MDKFAKQPIRISNLGASADKNIGERNTSTIHRIHPFSPKLQIAEPANIKEIKSKIAITSQRSVFILSLSDVSGITSVLSERRNQFADE